MTPPRASLASRWFLVAFLFAALYWTVDLAALRAGIPHPLDDSWEDNLIARQLLEGRGFRTLMIYPPLWGLRDPETLTIPVLVHGPVLPLLMVPPLALLGPESLDGVAWAAAACVLLATAPLFRLAARHFGPPVGSLAVALFTVAPITLQAVHHSLSVALGALLLVSILDLVARERPRGLAAGALAGVAYLVRPEMLLAAPVLALLAWRGRASREPLRFAVGFVAAPAGWWWHHWREVGSPLFNLSSYNLVGSWGGRPALSVLQDFELTPDRWPDVLRAELPTLWRKWLALFPRAAKNALFSPSGGTGWLALVGAAAALRAARAGRGAGGGRGADPGTPGDRARLAVAATLLALVPVATSTLALSQPLYMVPFLPLYALGAALGVRAIAERLPAWARRPRAWIAAGALLVLPSTVPAVREGERRARLLERRLAVERAALLDAAPPAAGAPRPIFSDTPDFVAWTTGRPTLWVTRDQFLRLYGSAEGARLARRVGLPARGGAGTWFHDNPRHPESFGRPAPGGP